MGRLLTIVGPSISKGIVNVKKSRADIIDQDFWSSCASGPEGQTTTGQWRHHTHRYSLATRGGRGERNKSRIDNHNFFFSFFEFLVSTFDISQARCMCTYRPTGAGPIGWAWRQCPPDSCVPPGAGSVCGAAQTPVTRCRWTLEGAVASACAACTP